MQSSFLCAFCGEPNDLSFDLGGGTHQEYVEDCQVCCQPNLLVIDYMPELEELSVSTQREDD